MKEKDNFYFGAKNEGNVTRVGNQNALGEKLSAPYTGDNTNNTEQLANQNTTEVGNTYYFGANKNKPAELSAAQIAVKAVEADKVNETKAIVISNETAIELTKKYTDLSDLSKIDKLENEYNQSLKKARSIIDEYEDETKEIVSDVRLTETGQYEKWQELRTSTKAALEGEAKKQVDNLEEIKAIRMKNLNKASSRINDYSTLNDLPHGAIEYIQASLQLVKQQVHTGDDPIGRGKIFDVDDPYQIGVPLSKRMPVVIKKGELAEKFNYHPYVLDLLNTDELDIRYHIVHPVDQAKHLFKPEFYRDYSMVEYEGYPLRRSIEEILGSFKGKLVYSFQDNTNQTGSNTGRFPTLFD